ncbi:hypothetical protein LK09_11140 [Microbacterium mangrovi]|uniref:DUF3159 domain-containing protein n=1 Tax=Microbacterium mangrovi TaxID=1348253 RepID=A0A0B2A220_9MICO|nr:DUF3159 domain-containing protein [Microbacterium mangrovi]KHK97544.1 hypothetical protein LK09_11140 [Microbacterium mangrovi]
MPEDASAGPASGSADPDSAATASEAFGAALGSAARRAGFDPAQADSTGHVVWHAMGGWRGVLESVLPGLAFVVTYTITRQLVLPLVVSLGIAVVFTLVRLVSRQPVTAALGGLVATAIAAGIALWTGRAQDNFLWGFFIDLLFGAVLLISLLVRRPLIGLAVGWLMDDAPGWREDPRKRRTFFWLTVLWTGLFAARLIVEVPLYLAGAVTALGTVKLLMGLPLFAPLVAVSWLAVRALYPRGSRGARDSGDSAPTTDR